MKKLLVLLLTVCVFFSVIGCDVEDDNKKSEVTQKNIENLFNSLDETADGIKNVEFGNSVFEFYGIDIEDIDLNFEGMTFAEFDYTLRLLKNNDTENN